MRIRSIKPEFWRSDDIASLELPDRLLFIGLWSYVDDNGVGRDQAALIVADLFAHDMERDPSETVARVSRGLASLSEGGLIHRYTHQKKRLLEIVAWSQHQRIDKPAKPRFPRSSADSRDPREGSQNPSEASTPGSVDQGSGNRGTGEQGAVDQVTDSIDSGNPRAVMYGVDPQPVIEKVEAKYGRTPDERAMAQMCDAVFGRAKNPRNPTAVLLKSVDNNERDWRAALAGEQVKR